MEKLTILAGNDQNPSSFLLGLKAVVRPQLEAQTELGREFPLHFWMTRGVFKETQDQLLAQVGIKSKSLGQAFRG